MRHTVIVTMLLTVSNVFVLKIYLQSIASRYLVEFLILLQLMPPIYGNDHNMHKQYIHVLEYVCVLLYIVTINNDKEIVSITGRYSWGDDRLAVMRKLH